MDWLRVGSEFDENCLPPLQELHARLSEGNDGQAPSCRTQIKNRILCTVV